MPEVTVLEFLTGTVWQPQILKFGIFPLLNATILTSVIAMMVALPLGIMIAIYLSEYASPARAASSNRCSRSWPASRPWSTVTSP